jgi:hypothetical protein
MKIYWMQFSENQVSNFIRFCAKYSISIFFTWHEEGFLSQTFFATVCDAGDGKITTEEKARLIEEHYKNSIRKSEAL